MLVFAIKKNESKKNNNAQVKWGNLIVIGNNPTPKRKIADKPLIKKLIFELLKYNKKYKINTNMEIIINPMLKINPVVPIPSSLKY